MATEKQQNKISKVMREFYAGKLTTHGNKVTDVSQAKAIALSEAGVSNKKSSAKKKMAKGGQVISKYDDEKYMSKRHYLRDTIESFFGKQNVYFNSADWGGMPVWTVKGDLYEGTFIVMGDEDDVILMTRQFDSELGEDVNNTLMQVEWQDINGLNDLLNTAMIIKNSGSKMAEGGVVEFYNKDNEHRLGRPSGSIEKELLDKVRYDSIKQDFVGNFGWKTIYNKLGDGYLFNLDDYDQDLMKNIALRPAERIYRYINRTTAIGGISPLIKINIEKGLLYFPIYNEADDIIFETRGIKALWINLIEDKYAEGGSVDSEGIDLFEDYDNIPEKVQKVLSKYAEAFEEGDYDGLKKASKAVEKVGYTFEYGLDGIAYDLRPIGTKGKSEIEEFAKGGKATSIPKSIIDKINEINSLIKWAEDKDNFVGGYFGGTYYEYLDFEKPIEIKNQFVYIEYNHGGGYTSFDRYNVNKKGEFDSNGLVELKSELSRILTAFRRAKKKYEMKGYFGHGGNIEKENKEMIASQVKEAKHHAEELSEILKEDKDIEAWVIAKMERATTDLSDVTHYLDGKNDNYAKGGGVGTVNVSELKKDMIVYPMYGSYSGKKGYVVGIMPDKKTVEVVFKNKVGNDYAKFLGNELTTDMKYAKGSTIKGGGIDYKDAISEFNSELINNPMVIKASEHYGKTPSEIVKALQIRLSTKGNRQGKTEQVWIDFEDKDSGIKIKHKKIFNNGEYAKGGGVGNKFTIDKIEKIIKSKNGKYLTISQYDEINGLMLSNKYDLLNDEENWKNLPSNLTELIEDSEMYYGFTENEIKKFLTKVNTLGYTFNYVDVATQDNGGFSHTFKPYALRKLEHTKNLYDNGGGVGEDCGCGGGSEYGTGGGVDHECKCDEGGVYNNPFLKSIFGI